MLFVHDTICFMLIFFFNDTATTEIYTYCHTLSLHDALPILPDLASPAHAKPARRRRPCRDDCHRHRRRSGRRTPARRSPATPGIATAVGMAGARSYRFRLVIQTVTEPRELAPQPRPPPDHHVDRERMIHT